MRQAEAFANDLELWLKGEPIYARRPNAAEMALKWARKRPAWVVFLTAIFLTASVGFPAVLYLWRQAEVARQAQDRAREKA